MLGAQFGNLQVWVCQMLGLLAVSFFFWFMVKGYLRSDGFLLCVRARQTNCLQPACLHVL